MIRQAMNNDIDLVARLAHELWKHDTVEDLVEEMAEYINSKNKIIFLCFNKGQAIGFVQGSLRYDYVEGTVTSPVGYLEGIFVESSYRKKGIGKKLAQKCEEWARAQGCREFASDCGINNGDSLNFHLKLGFEEAGRIICFKKQI